MTRGRAHLIAKLRERGLSYRMAIRVIDQIFSSMKEALQRGEEVELPIGSLKVVRHKRRPKRGWYLNRITTTYEKPFTVALVNKGSSSDDLRGQPG
jgi:nucleoid DNA-binding protein